jgi:thiol-disulfide isomerase/thioredoxin
MLSIPLGPLALPVAPLLLMLSLWLASVVASRFASRIAMRPDASRASADGRPEAGLAGLAGDAFFHAAFAGLAIARIVHLAQHADAYGADPWSMIDLRDGGWHAASGTIAGLGWLAVRAWRIRPLARPLAAGAVTAVCLWTFGSLALGRHDTPALPDLMVTDLATGRTMTLVEAAAGRPVVVNLWASWCGPCRQEMPVLAAAQRREPGVGFLFVNQGEAPAAIRAYLQREQLALDGVLLDSASALGPAVGSRGLPTTLFHDAQGRRVGAHFGVINAAGLEARLRALRPPR